jgi:hypothetical protein
MPRHEIQVLFALPGWGRQIELLLKLQQGSRVGGIAVIPVRLD